MTISDLPQTGTFFGKYVFCLLIAQPHHVRFKAKEYKQIRYEIALGSDSRQMVKGTKQIWWSTPKLSILSDLENSVSFRISCIYLLFYVPICSSNRDLFVKFHIYHYCF